MAGRRLPSRGVPTWQRKRSRLFPFFPGHSSHHRAHLMASLKPNYLPKASAPNTTMLRTGLQHLKLVGTQSAHKESSPDYCSGTTPKLLAVRSVGPAAGNKIWLTLRSQGPWGACSVCQRMSPRKPPKIVNCFFMFLPIFPSWPVLPPGYSGKHSSRLTGSTALTSSKGSECHYSV